MVLQPPISIRTDTLFPSTTRCRSRVGDTGPFVSIFHDGAWEGEERGTHGAVVIWYSPEMADWVRANRPAGDEATGPDAAPVPDGAIMVKEMYPAPAARCVDGDPTMLKPSSGAAVMVRDAEGAHDRSEEHTSELQSLMRISYAVFCLKKKTHRRIHTR